VACMFPSHVRGALPTLSGPAVGTPCALRGAEGVGVLGIA